MVPNSPRASAFRKSVLELRLLSDSEIDQVLEQSNQSGLSPIELLIKKGMVTPADVDVLDLLSRSDDALPGYELLGLIGRGGMGVVYRARQKALQRVVALKTVLANKATDKLALARFEREALTIAQLSHPNIVNPLDFGQHDGRFYLAMELVEGEDLDAYIDQRGPLPEWAAWGIARQIAAGLLHASRAGVIHRDIKPANILLVKPPEGHALRPGLPMAKISDFGLAILNTQQVVAKRLTSEDSKIGSPNYMAPEQFETSDCDTRADIYALGATVFHILTGHPPWQGKPVQQIFMAKVHRETISVGDFRPNLSAETIALVANMMEPHVDRRIANYEQLMAAMASLSETGAPAPLASQAFASNANHADTPTLDISISESTLTDLSAPERAKTESPVARVGVRRWWLIASVGLLFCASLAALLWSLANRRSLPLVQTSEQLSLFDGESVFSPSISQLGGGWAARQGRLIHEAGSLGGLTFQIPPWNYFAFEVIVENIAANSVIVQFAAQQAEGAGRRSALQLTGDRAQLGSLSQWRSEFLPSSKDFPLDAQRAEHSVKIERRTSSWVAFVNGLEVGAVGSNSENLSEITIAVRKLDAQVPTSEAPNRAIQGAAFSEILATRLQPATGSSP